MANSQETDVEAPATPSGFMRDAAPAKIEAEVETEPAWYWCATCKLASTRAGDCWGCRKPYATAPEIGVPDAPHMPKVAGGRTTLSIVASIAGTLALLGVAAVGIFLLAVNGDSTTQALNAGATGNTVDGSSSFSVGVLHGTVRLPGTWGTSMIRLQLPATMTAGAQLKNDLSIGKGSETIVVASFQSSDPSGVLNQFVMTKPQTSTDTMGDRITDEPSRDNLSIAGFTTVAQDYEVRNAKGGLISRGTTYVISTGAEVVYIRASASAAQAGDLAGIEQALVNIG